MESPFRVLKRQYLILDTYAQNIQDATLDRSYEYDHLGRLAISHSGAEARAHTYSGQWGTTDGPYSQGYEYDVWGNVTHKYGWGGEVQGGSPSASTDITYSYTNNRRNGFSYDAAGNVTNDGGQNFTYDATGQQTLASYSGYSLQQHYDGDGLRVKKNDNGAQTYYLRSSVLGGQVVAEIVWASVSWQWSRGYVYLGSQLLAVQQGGVYWMHEDPVTKSKRVTNSTGTVVSIVETDPWGADTARSSNAAFQPKKFTSYDRDQNGTDEAMFRRYNRWQSRFDQPDPYDGSYSMTDPQSFNRYAYVQNDPVNFVDPLGLDDFPIGWWRNPDGSIGTGFRLPGPTVYGSVPRGLGGGGGRGGAETPLVEESAGNEGVEPGGPQNPAPAPGQTLSQEDCDKKIASIFGGPGAVAATVNEPSTLQHPSAGINRFNHLAGNGTFHLYSNAQGTAATGGLYAPGGFVGRPVTGTVYQEPNDPNPGQVNYNYERFNYRGGLSISFVHVGNPGVNRSDRNAAGSIRVGNIAGPGGAGAGYNHTHVNVYQNGRRVDPRGVFCR